MLCVCCGCVVGGMSGMGVMKGAPRRRLYQGIIRMKKGGGVMEGIYIILAQGGGHLCGAPLGP